MTKIRFRVGAEDLENVDKDSGDFVVPPKGYYIAAIKEAEAGFSKKKDSDEEDPKKPRVKIILQLVGVGRDGEAVTENYGNIWDYISFSKESGWKRGEFLWALGLIDSKEDIDIEVDTEELVGQQVLIRVKHEKDNRDASAVNAKVAKYLRATDADGEAAFGAVAASGDDEDSGSVFGGEEESGYYTEETLAELEMKPLGEVAKEFDLDPNEFLVKGKNKKVDVEATKRAVIGAILTAQGAPGDESGDGGAEEESPF